MSLDDVPVMSLQEVIEAAEADDPVGLEAMWSRLEMALAFDDQDIARSWGPEDGKRWDQFFKLSSRYVWQGDFLEHNPEGCRLYFACAWLIALAEVQGPIQNLRAASRKMKKFLELRKPGLLWPKAPAPFWLPLCAFDAILGHTRHIERTVEGNGFYLYFSWRSRSEPPQCALHVAHPGIDEEGFLLYDLEPGLNVVVWRDHGVFIFSIDPDGAYREHPVATYVPNPGPGLAAVERYAKRNGLPFYPEPIVNDSIDEDKIIYPP